MARPKTGPYALATKSRLMNRDGVDISVVVSVYWGVDVTGTETAGATAAEKEFTRFFKEAEPRLSYAFFATYGPDVGSDVTSETLVYAWEHWDRIRRMENPAGYLYRVGQSKARWYHRPRRLFPAVIRSEVPEVEPGLPKALELLTRNQRLAVVLIHGLEWTEQEVAQLIGRSRSTVRTHLERGLLHLREELEVRIDA